MDAKHQLVAAGVEPGAAPDHLVEADGRSDVFEVAFVDDDMAEVVLGIVFGEKAGVAIHAVYAEGLIGGDMDAGVFGIVGAVAATPDLGGVGAEDVLKGAKGLGAQLVTVADEQGAV